MTGRIKKLKDKEILFLIEDHLFTYSENKELDTTNEEFSKIKNIILSDLNYDIKLLSIPDVRDEDRKNIIINSVKKHSLVEINDNNIDYKVLYNETDKVYTAVFIKKENEIDIENKKIFTTCQILENLIIRGDFPSQTTFCIMYDKVAFLYDFNNGYFVKRSIILEKDLESIKDRESDIYCLNFNNKNIESLKFKKIPKEQVDKTIFTLKEGLFNKIENFEFIRNILIGLFMFITIIVLFELGINNFKNENGKILKDLKTLEKTLKGEKAKRGISDKLFKEYSFLIKNKSSINEFFFLLNEIGKDNMEIEGVSFADKKFSITGSCKNDSILEDNFRKSEYFKNIAFSFTKKDNKLFFRIEGEYINE